MRAGSLFTPLVIESSSATRNELNEDVVSWAAFRTTSGRVVPQAGREFEAARQRVAELTHLISVRYHPAKVVTPGMRVKLGSRVLDIVSAATVDERKREQQLLCVEAVA